MKNTIIITGASRGIGNFLMKKFDNKDYEIIGTYNATEPNASNKSDFVKIDISDFYAVESFVEKIKEQLGGVILLNCAAINYNSFAHKSDINQWKNVIDVNLVGTFNMIRVLLPTMRKNNFGRIVNFSSVVAQSGVIGTSAYAASKSALWGLSKCIAVENATKGITINTLNLGYFNIGMISDVPPNLQGLIKQKIPTGEFGNPENLYNAVRFLIETDYINGANIDINAGLL